MFTRDEKNLLIELVSNEQIHMIKKHPERYESEEYKNLERLKVKLKEVVEKENTIYETVKG